MIFQWKIKRVIDFLRVLTNRSPQFTDMHLRLAFVFLFLFLTSLKFRKNMAWGLASPRLTVPVPSTHGSTASFESAGKSNGTLLTPLSENEAKTLS